MAKAKTADGLGGELFAGTPAATGLKQTTLQVHLAEQARNKSPKKPEARPKRTARLRRRNRRRP